MLLGASQSPGPAEEDGPQIPSLMGQASWVFIDSPCTDPHVNATDQSLVLRTRSRDPRRWAHDPESEQCPQHHAWGKA